jgi:hypothetical protein
MEHVTETKKRPFISPKVGGIIGIIVIALAVIATIISGPHEQEYDNLFGPPLVTPTVSVTNLIATQPVKQQFSYQGVNVYLTQALLANKFSDDRKSTGKYTVRVMLNTKSTNTEAVGVKYDSLLHLLLPNGQIVDTKLVSINAVELPNTPQSGFVDFPVSEKVDLATLELQMGSQIVPLR